MNKQLKTLFVLAFAMVMSVTSCLNENEDVNSGPAKLPSNVDSFAEQMEAMKGSVVEIEVLQSSLAETSGLQATASQLETCVAMIEEHIASVESGFTGVPAVVAAMNIQGKVAATTGALKANIGMLDAEDVAGLQSPLLSIEKSVKSWLGKDFKSFFEVSSEVARLASMINVVESQSLSADAMMSDVEVGLRVGDASDDLKTVVATVGTTYETLTQLNDKMVSLCAEVEGAYVSLFNAETGAADKLKTVNTKAGDAVTSSNTTLSDLSRRISACETALEDIDARLKKVEADVAALLNMIQSVTFMPAYSTENAYAYYNMDVNTKVQDVNLPYNGKAKRTATGEMELSFIVRPAAASTALNANTGALSVMGYYATQISQMAVNASDYFNLDIKKVVATDANRGLVTVTVEPRLREAFYYKEIGAKCALAIKSGKTDVVSKFIEILPKDNSNTVYVQSITPSKSEIYMKKGEFASLSATVYPDNVSKPGYDLYSTDTRIVRLDETTGQLYAYGVGNATIQVVSKGTDEWGLPVTSTCSVKVDEAFMLSGPPYVEVGYETQLFLDYPSSAIVETKVWKSSDESKLTVDQDGKVKGVSHTYNVNTKEYSQVTVSCTINGVTTVSWDMKVAATQPKKIITENLSENQSEIQIRVNESLSLASTIYPDNVPAGAYKIIYQSDQPGLGWIDFDSGLISSNRNTYATTAWVTITVENYDKEKYYVSDSRVKRVVAVKVIPYYVKTITLADVEIQVGQAAVTLTPKITSDVSGKEPTNSALTWTSSNEAIAKVDQNGKVTPVAAGTATITATAQDGSNVSGSCKVTVTQPWKNFNVGDYVVRESNGDIGFYADLNTAKSNGRSIVGVVISKTNPRVTDTALPASCTHGIAIALGETKGKWWTDSYHANATSVSSWAAQNGYAFVDGKDKYSGYTNTQTFKAYVNKHSVTSDLISNLDYYNSTSGAPLPNGTSKYYLPSVPAMVDAAKISNGNYAGLSDKLVAAGGTKFNHGYGVTYWTVSENGQTNAYTLSPLLGGTPQSSTKTSDYNARYVFAF